MRNLSLSLTALVLLATSALSGCAWTAQQVNLRPTIQVARTDLGQGQPIYVDVEDERTDNAIGNRIPTGGGELTPAQDPALVVRNGISEGMAQLGFKPVAARDARIPELRVELRALDYKVTQGFWAGGLSVDVALKAICVRGDARPHEQLHRGHHEESIQVVQSASNNEEYINSALSQALNQVLSDRDLLECLAAAQSK